MTKGKLDVWEVLRISSGLGFIIALPICGGTIVGFFLDKRYGSAPVLTIIFLIGGIFLAIWVFINRIKKIL